MQLLIVDDDDFALSVLDSTLARMGYSVLTARDGAQAMEILRKGDIRLVITDWDMPNMDGLSLCRAVRKAELPGYVYIIMLTGREGAKQRIEGLCAGADDFINKPLDPEELLVCLKTSERILSLETRDLALFALAKLVESRDPDTTMHLDRLQHYCRLIAQNLSAEVKACYGVDDEYIRLLYQTSALHDLGKIVVPDAILLKKSELTPDEMAIMQTHTIVGSDTLNAALARFPDGRYLVMAKEIAATHHERFDGSGYPRGLAAAQIPLSGRIVALADVYDTITSRRVYKDAHPHEQAMQFIRGVRGSHFDPDVVDAFIRAETQILAVREKIRDESKPGDAATVNLPATPPLGHCGPSPRKILIAEDDPIIRAKLVELLRVTGEPLIEAADGHDAFNLYIEHRPRLVISDWVMPRIDGVQLCRQLRSIATDVPVHFIMLTANSDKSQLLTAYDAGADDFIPKPFECEELLARVRAGIRATKLQDELMCKAAGSQALNAKLAIMNSRLERLSITDELTGLFNRRQAMARLEEQWALVSRYPKPLSIAMIDIDHFKQINDTHGHDAGDAVLRRISVILRDQTRGTDVLCRFGGEEFLIIFPTQSLEEAMVCAERCRAAVAAHPFQIGAATLRTTISIGLATRTREMQRLDDLIKTTDRALYRAKARGRNKVCLAGAEDADSAAPVEAPPAPAEPPRPPFDQAAVLKRCGGDAAFAAAVTERFRAAATTEVGKIGRALAAADATAVQRTAHSLKSMAAYVAADRASELAKRIEDLGRANDLVKITPLVEQLASEIEQVNQWIARMNAEPAAKK